MAKVKGKRAANIKRAVDTLKAEGLTLADAAPLVMGKRGALAAMVRLAWSNVGLFGTDDQEAQSWLAEHGMDHDDAYGAKVRKLVQATRKKMLAKVERDSCCYECGSQDVWEPIRFVDEDGTEKGGAELDTPVIIYCYDCQAVTVD